MMILSDFCGCDERKITIKDIYKQNKSDDTPMLSDYESRFWLIYVTQYQHLDRIFMRRYESFFPMDQDGDVVEISDTFRDDVYAWLLMNDKRYSELYRVNVIDDENYSLTNNYDMTETLERTEDITGERVKGSETISDQGSNIYGAQTVGTETETVMGSQENGTSETINKGEQENETENTVSAFNVSTYEPETKSITNEGAREDGREVSETLGSRTDTIDTSTSYGSHTDTMSNVRTDGQRTDTDERNLIESSSLHRVGNIGVTTVDDMLQKHIDTWTAFDFYGFIFDEIAREFLRC